MDLAELPWSTWYSDVDVDEILLLGMESGMSNYKRDVYRAENERQERMMTTNQRQTSAHTRRDGLTRTPGWLAAKVGRPAAAIASNYAARVSHRAVVYYRRASTRAAGLVLKPLDV